MASAAIAGNAGGAWFSTHRLRAFVGDHLAFRESAFVNLRVGYQDLNPGGMILFTHRGYGSRWQVR